MYPDAAYKERYDMYGYSKMLNEAELVKLKEKMRVIILNPSLVLGPGSERIESAFRAARRLPIMPMLSYINSFVDARDVAQAVILALKEGRNGERYIVTAYNESMLDATRFAAKTMGRKTPVVQISSRGLRALDQIVILLDKLKLNPGIRLPSEMAVDKSYSAEKIRREMGWQPQYTLEETISYSILGEKDE
jgi:dihydroflavonol-4-reductase